MDRFSLEGENMESTSTVMHEIDTGTHAHFENDYGITVRKYKKL